jgi:hypothetical protein
MPFGPQTICPAGGQCHSQVFIRDEWQGTANIVTNW